MRIFPRHMIILTILLIVVSGLIASLSSCSNSSQSSGSTPNTEQAAEQPAAVQTEPAETAPSQEHHADNDGSHSSDDNNVYSHSYKTADIGQDAVIAIVLERVPGASRSNIDEIEREHDDGRIEYEGELHYNGYEYEFEIDGATGNILKWEIDD